MFTPKEREALLQPVGLRHREMCKIQASKKRHSVLLCLSGLCPAQWCPHRYPDMSDGALHAAAGLQQVASGRPGEEAQAPWTGQRLACEYV